jgi:tetratricopeptide (TPR) repeat protein
MAADKERDPGSFSAEIGKYLDILAKDPNSRVFAPLAEAYRKAGFLDDAVETALEGLKSHPNYLGGRVALGRAYFEKKQYADATAEMQKVAKAAPDNIIAHKVLGQIAYHQSDLPAAERAFKMVLLLDPRDQEAHEFIANLAGGAPAAPAPAPVQPAPALLSPTPTPVAATPTAIAPAAPQRATPPPSAPLPFDEIQGIEDIDLQADDIFGEPAASPEQSGATEPPAVAAPESWFPGGQPPVVPGEALPPSAPEPAVLAPSRAVEPPPAPVGGMELEVFSRVPWGADAERAAPLPSAPPPAPVVAPEETESPFEVFGRPQRGGPPQSTRGEQSAFGEIDLESTAHEPAQSAPEPEEESPFETFTRQPGLSAAPAPIKVERGRVTGPREIDVETTAYTPSDTFTPDSFDAPVLNLDEELPRIDLAQEMDFGSPADLPPSPEMSEPAPAPEPVPEIEVEPGPGMDLAVDFEPEMAPQPEQQSPEAAVPVEPAVAPIDAGGEELPPWDELTPDEETPGAAAGRGVFDTETLASIYVNQGFYGRAAEIYQRLIAQRPDDEGLRGKLEAVLALERGEAASEEPVAAVDAAATHIGPEQVISQLQTLLETFKGGRPR